MEDCGRRSVKKNSLPGILNQMAADALRDFGGPARGLPLAVVRAGPACGSPITWPQDFPEFVFPSEMVHAHSR